MTEEAWKGRLKVRMAELQLTMKSLSLAAGLGETGVRDMLKRTHSPSIDAVAKVAKALDMTLSALYEGVADNATVSRRLCSIDLIGESAPNRSAWFELVGSHSIVLDQISGRLISVSSSTNLIAIYHLDGIAVFEKLPPEDVEGGDGTDYLILAKNSKRFLGTIVSKLGEQRDKRLLLDDKLELWISNIDWIAKWKHSLPRVRS